MSFFSYDFKVLTNLRTRTVTLSSLCRSPNSFAFMICAIPQGSAARNKDEVWQFIFSSALTSRKHSSGMWVLLNTLLVSSVNHVNHFGPSFQRGHFDSSTGLNPLEGKSAGLSFSWQCYHVLAGTRFLISSTRFRTNCFHSLSSPLIHNNVTLVVDSKNEEISRARSCEQELTGWRIRNTTSITTGIIQLVVTIYEEVTL